MSTETAIHISSSMPLKHEGFINDEPSNIYRQHEFPSPPTESLKPPSPSINPSAQLPSTPTISTLHLPIPLVCLPSHTPSKSTIIPSLPHNPINGGGGIGSIPSSVKDLRSLASSIGHSTLRPISTNEGGSTIRPAPGLGGSLISFGGQLRNLDKSFLRQFVTRSKEGSDTSSSTVRLDEHGMMDGRRLSGEKKPGGIDEVDVEWCFFCGKERIRAEMGLREVNLVEMLSPTVIAPGMAESIQNEDEKEGGKSWQWVCKRCDRE
ncbi:hypothetical protein I203_103032 [Kwoniella mangroviensis CBS 8507]|uniref:uncharacterized protein n=1 Tax=Kwoniella mangroviensis CBS 8507 TaxID=1296122 RepID=UPI00080D458F|nr:uncharacterized protein I203_04009 [Kwoniella mangroviensis CBS 8507]OCF67319.1 hypothetical protein I203_04009 [Kwoniella mangroviensis CBS 8507]